MMCQHVSLRKSVRRSRPMNRLSVVFAAAIAMKTETTGPKGPNCLRPESSAAIMINAENMNQETMKVTKKIAFSRNRRRSQRPIGFTPRILPPQKRSFSGKVNVSGMAPEAPRIDEAKQTNLFSMAKGFGRACKALAKGLRRASGLQAPRYHDAITVISPFVNGASIRERNKLSFNVFGAIPNNLSRLSAWGEGGRGTGGVGTSLRGIAFTECPSFEAPSLIRTDLALNLVSVPATKGRIALAARASSPDGRAACASQRFLFLKGVRHTTTAGEGKGRRLSSPVLKPPKMFNKTFWRSGLIYLNSERSVRSECLEQNLDASDLTAFSPAPISPSEREQEYFGGRHE